MSDSTFFVSEAAVRYLKQRAQMRLSGVSSSHLSECIAAGLGHKTYASLRSALSGRATVEVPKPSNVRLAARLRELGYSNVPEDFQLLPELERSTTPFRTFPLRKRRSARWWAWRNLLVASINAGLAQRMFGLSPEQNWWPGGAENSHECRRGRYSFRMSDGSLVIVSVDAISGDELALHVVLNPRNAEKVPYEFSSLLDGDAVAHCWVERRLGAWIQDGGEDFSCKRTAQARLLDMVIEPVGYSDQGIFIL